MAYRRCPNCHTAVGDDAVECSACGASLAASAQGPRAAAAGAASGAGNPVFGNAGGNVFAALGLGKGTSAISGAVEGFVEQLFQAFGETAVRLLGMKTGAAAIDDNPWAVTRNASAEDLFKRRLYRLTFGWRTRLSEKDLIGLYRDLAKYADAGVGFHDALGRLEKSTKSAVLARVLHEIRSDLLDGSTLGDAFGKHAYLFEPLHLALLEVGESLGTLGDNMRLLVETIEERRDLRRQIARKFVQPIGLIFIANYVLTIPVFMAAGMLGYLETVLPPTFAIGFLGFTALVVVPVVTAAAGRDLTDRVKFSLPAFGSIARANALARFARALGAALGAGVEVGKALAISAKAADNVVVAKAVTAAMPLVQEHGLAEGLKRGGVLPEEIAAELAHGEATGTVAPTLAQIAKEARGRAARGTAILGGILSFAMIVFSVLYCVYSVFTKALFGARNATHGLTHPLKGLKHFPGTKPSR
ncbi:MAG TPA: type II secretion system F family protein [bacterium]|nr:type II secretion system F family protein [bacterium]